MSHESARDRIAVSRHDPSNSSNAVNQLRAIAALCNSGEFDAASSHLPLHERKINGDATDKAILRFSEGLGEVSHLRQFWKKDFELAFNSKNKFMIRSFSLLGHEGLKYTVSSEEERQYDSDDVSV